VNVTALHNWYLGLGLTTLSYNSDTAEAKT